MSETKLLPVTVSNDSFEPLTLRPMNAKGTKSMTIKWIGGALLVVVVMVIVFKMSTVDHQHDRHDDLTDDQLIELMDENVENDHLMDFKQERILIVGGIYTEESLEYFYPNHPERNTLLNVTLITERYGHVSILLNETTVLTIGGRNRSVWVGNRLKRRKLRTTEIFNTVTDRISPFANLSVPRSCNPGAALLTGTIYVCGGSAESPARWSLDPIRRSCEILNPETNTSNSTSAKMESMIMNRQFFTLLSSHGSLFAVGGQTGWKFPNDYTRSVERYYPNENKWHMVAPMIVRRAGLAATVLNNTIYACGGLSGIDGSLAIAESSCEKYNVEKNSWHKIASMHKERSGFVLVAFRDKLVAIGGHADTYGVEMYDPIIDKWNRLTNGTIKGRHVSTAVVL